MPRRIPLPLIAAAACAAPTYGANTPPAGDPGWASRGQIGFSKTSGNTDTETANFLVHAAHEAGRWKFLVAAEGLYGATQGQTTAQAWRVRLQENHMASARLYLYGAADYSDDRFSGFAYQALLSGGVGYQFIDNDATKLSGQVGVGARRLLPEILVKDAIGAVISRTQLETETDAVLDAAVKYEHAFNESTKILAGAAVDSGKQNTLSTASVALQVKMSAKLALAAGYKITNNSKPPAGSKNTDTLTTLNLVYEIKNPKLSPD